MSHAPNLWRMAAMSNHKGWPAVSAYRSQKPDRSTRRLAFTSPSLSALPGLEALLRLVDDIDAALAADKLVVAVAVPQRFQGISDFHDTTQQFGEKGLGRARHSVEGLCPRCRSRSTPKRRLAATVADAGAFSSARTSIRQCFCRSSRHPPRPAHGRAARFPPPSPQHPPRWRAHHCWPGFRPGRSWLRPAGCGAG